MFLVRTIDTTHGIMSMILSERQLPRVTLEYGLFLTPIDDTYDVGDRILQWSLKLTVKNEPWNYFPSPIWLDDYDLRRYQPSEIGEG